MNLRKIELALCCLIIELLALNTSFFFVFRNELTNTTSGGFSFLFFIQGSLIWIMTYIIITKKNLYLRDGFSGQAWRITIRTLVYLIISLVFTTLFINSPFLTISKLLISVLIFYLLTLIIYYIINKISRVLKFKEAYRKKSLIIGTDMTAKLLGSILTNNKVLGYQFLGYVSTKEKINENNKNEIGIIKKLPEIIDQLKIQELFVTFSVFEDQSGLKELLKLSINKGVRIKLVPKRESFFNFKNQASISSLRVIDPFEFPLDNFWLRLQKRIFDIIFSGLVIVFILSWLIPILGLIIKINSKGPIFFVQKRTGLSNRTFNCLKFRTMRLNNERDLIQATKRDVRVTSIGKLMRRSNIDELPQFLNVFVGNMSVVGPRPHMLAHTNFYSKSIVDYKSRHYIKPGITGWAQINSFRGETDKLWKMKKRVEYDLQYIENWSLLKDIKIIITTVFDKKSYLNAI